MREPLTYLVSPLEPGFLHLEMLTPSLTKVRRCHRCIVLGSAIGYRLIECQFKLRV
jgi:hypothetical protein